MKSTINLPRPLTNPFAPALALSVCLAAPVAAQPPTTTGATPRPDEAQRSQSDTRRDDVRQLEVFKLEHREPGEVKRIITMAERATAQDPQYTSPVSYNPTSPAHQPGTTAGAVTPSSTSDEGDLLMATNEEKGLLFVRGKEEQLENVRDLVTAIDVRDEELRRHEYGDVQLLPVPTDATSTLAELNLQGEMMQSGGIHLLVFRDGADDEVVKQAEQVIQRLNGQTNSTEDKDEDDATKREDRREGNERRPGGQ